IALTRLRSPLTRREALCRMGGGFGMMAFAGMVRESLARAEVTAIRPRAKHVIFLFMNGGLSQVDSFDPKPALEKYHGQPLPGGSIATERKTGTLMKSPFQFKKDGKAGMEVIELSPLLGECADPLCPIRPLHPPIPTHHPPLIP